MFCGRSSPKKILTPLPGANFLRTLPLLVLILAGALNFSYSAKTSESPASSGSQFDGPAELPRLSVSSSLASTPTPGRVREVRSEDNLQSVLNQAQCGEKIQLQAGVTFQGSFVLPSKDCDDQHWVILRSNAPDHALPREGERITPCFAGVTSIPGRPPYPCSSPHNAMAKVVAAKGLQALRLADGANHYRIGPGLELTRAAGDGIHYGLIGRQQDPTAKGINHVVVDRDWIHGTATDETVRGIFLGGFTYAAVVDSYINDFHCVAVIGGCVDSQAIAGGVGKIPEGPWKIENNFLEAGAENILFGGGGGTIVPSDITIRHNHLFKPLTWMPGQRGFVGAVNSDPGKCVRFNAPGYCPFIVKNLFELKNAQRLLFEGNVLENSWPGFSQRGASIALQVMSEGGNPSATVADITIRYNRAAHTSNGIGIKAPPSNNVAQPKLLARISIHDDVFDDIGPAYYNGTTRDVEIAFQIGRCPSCAPLHDITIDHVTMLLQHPQNLMTLGAPLADPIANFVFTNNIVSAPGNMAITGTGPAAPCGYDGKTNAERWANCTTHGLFAHNVLIGATGAWPRQNFLDRSLNEVGFVNANEGRGGDYRLATISRHKHAGIDGKDPGADIDAVERATQGVTSQP
jgi:hypothetical protein